MLCKPAAEDEKLYTTNPLESERAEGWVTPSTATVMVPVGVAPLELNPEDTVTVMASATPASTELLAANREVFEFKSAAEDTVTVDEPLDDA